MIFKGSNLFVMDNSGAIVVYCVGFITAIKRIGINFGDIILVTLKEVSATKKLKKGQLWRALVLNTKSMVVKSDTSMAIKFLINSVIILKKEELVPVATRLFIIVPVEFMFGNFKRLVSIAVFKI
jgi:large subunit ribosomal protein L14